MKNAFALIAVLVASGCSTAAPPPTSDALITLEKGGCGYIAACPAYVISMKPDGRYRYEGFKNVSIIGVREGQLSSDSWKKAEAAFTNAGWADLADPASREGGYPCMSDSPFARITRKVRAGEQKVFNFNLGCDSKQGTALLRVLDEMLPTPVS